MRVAVEPEVIIWAIQRGGYDLHSFIASFPKVERWIKKGGKQPTVAELQWLSGYVNIPFGFLLLKVPLKERLPVPFFSADRGQIDWVNIHVYDALLLMQRRQAWLSYYLRDRGAAAHPYVGRFNANANANAIVDDMRNVLGVTEYWARAFSHWKEALIFLIEKMERAGVVVVLSGALKNDNFHNIPLEQCRGVALSDPFAPYVMVNTADSKEAQMLTLLYALVHIWLGQSAGFDLSRLQPADHPLERLCYKAAAEFLLPEEIFRSAWTKTSDIAQLVSMFRVSPLLVARRAIDIGGLSMFDFLQFQNAYNSRRNAEGGGWSNQRNPGGLRARKLGETLARHMKEAVLTHRLLYREAYGLSKMKGEAYRRLLSL